MSVIGYQERKSIIIRGDIKIPYSRITKTCRELWVSSFLNVCGKSEKANREGAKKNSGGKRQAYYQTQVSTGKRQADLLLVLGECTHRPETSGITLASHLSGQTQRRQRWKWPAIYLYLPLAGSRPAFFHRYFFAPSLLHQLLVVSDYHTLHREMAQVVLWNLWNGHQVCH